MRPKHLIDRGNEGVSPPLRIPTDSPGRLAILARPRGGDWLPVDVTDWKRSGQHAIVSMLTADEVSEFEPSATAALEPV